MNHHSRELTSNADLKLEHLLGTPDARNLAPKRLVVGPGIVVLMLLLLVILPAAV